MGGMSGRGWTNQIPSWSGMNDDSDNKNDDSVAMMRKNGNSTMSFANLPIWKLIELLRKPLLFVTIAAAAATATACARARSRTHVCVIKMVNQQKCSAFFLLLVSRCPFKNIFGHISHSLTHSLTHRFSRSLSNTPYSSAWKENLVEIPYNIILFTIGTKPRVKKQKQPKEGGKYVYHWEKSNKSH